MTNNSQAIRTRWSLWIWPLLSLLMLGAVAAWWNAAREGLHRQDQVLGTMAIVSVLALLAGVWSLIWLLLLSRLPWRSRLFSIGISVALLWLALLSIEFRGVSGDMVPILGWRWSSDARALADRRAQAPGTMAHLESDHDYPSFGGPLGDFSIPDLRLSRVWQPPPHELWRQPVGAALSGVAVAGDFAVTMEQAGEQEQVTCYDVQSGILRWSHAVQSRWYDALGGEGPRATPAIAGGRVFALGGRGLLRALELETGALLWSVDTLADNLASPPDYGVSSSPLVLADGTVVVAVGGRAGRALVGYDGATGRRRWSGGSAPPGYGSPRLAHLAGRSQILVLNDDALTAHDASDGHELWSYDWPSGTEPTFTPLTLEGDRVFVSTGYGVGGKMLRVVAGPEGSFDVALLWESISLKSKFSNAVHRKGVIYGLDDGILAAVNAETGERLWKNGRYGHGQIVCVDDLIVVIAEDGRVALVEASPAAFAEVASFQALSGKCWNPPALAGNRLIVRNDREAAAFELPRSE